MQKNENRPGYKKTRIGWIPNDWDVSPVGNTEHFLTSGSRGWSQYYSDSGALFVRITNLTRESIDLDYADCRFVNLPLNGSEGTRTRLEDGDVLISITADLGIIAYFAAHGPYPHAYVNQHVALLRLLDKAVSSKFVAYQLSAQQAQKRFKQITDQGAKAGLNLPAIRSFFVSLPSFAEQEAIAGVLQCWDKAIRNYEKKIEKKRNIKMGLMQRLLSGKQRLPGFSGEWKEVRLKELLSYGRPDKHIVQSTEYSQLDGIPVLTANKSFILGYTSETSGVCSNTPVIVFDDFTTSIQYADFPFKVKSSAIKLLRPAHDQVDLRFVFERMQQLHFSVGEHKRHYISEYQYLRLAVPDLAEQRAIASVLTKADADIAAPERKLGVLNEQKRFLLNNLVTGTIRLPQFVGTAQTADTKGDTE
ncbi:restriction endonuclease subunit S [Candidatus Bipolaricaulota bacterium]|nr:restriction endonuclease subunit S [Candidatus Bipolaricaulota bacterium]